MYYEHIPFRQVEPYDGTPTPPRHKKAPAQNVWAQMYRDEKDNRRGYCLLSDGPKTREYKTGRKYHPNDPRKTHCKYGHERTPENIMKNMSCRKCHNAMQSAKKRALPKKTHCKAGHPRTPENLYKGGSCRACTLHRARIKYAPNYMNERKSAA